MPHLIGIRAGRGHVGSQCATLTDFTGDLPVVQLPFASAVTSGIVVASFKVNLAGVSALQFGLSTGSGRVNLVEIQPKELNLKVDLSGTFPEVRVHEEFAAMGWLEAQVIYDRHAGSLRTRYRDVDDHVEATGPWAQANRGRPAVAGRFADLSHVWIAFQNNRAYGDVHPVVDDIKVTVYRLPLKVGGGANLRTFPPMYTPRWNCATGRAPTRRSSIWSRRLPRLTNASSVIKRAATIGSTLSSVACFNSSLPIFAIVPRN